MSNHYIALNRGQGGFKYSDFVVGVASSAASDIELRMADAAGLKREDVIFALKAFIRAMEQGQQITLFPPL